MKGKKLRELFRQKTTKTGAMLLAAALVLGSSMWVSDQSGSIPELTTFVDNPESVEIDADETPLSDVQVKTSTKTNKKTKKVKLKKKSTKTYSKKTPTKKKTTTSKKTTSEETITTKTVTATSMTSSFKKGSNINTQVTTTKTTVTTTTVASSSASAASAVTSTAASAASVNGIVELSKAAPRLNANIANAFNTLGFKVKVDSSVTYSGLFDARTQSVTLKKLDDTVYHELGHFVAFAAGNADTSAAFQQIFAQEKAQYTDYNKAYVLSSSSEYFAESFKNYTLNPSALKASRPQTYEAIEKAIAAVTPAQVAKMKAVYSAIWS